MGALPRGRPPAFGTWETTKLNRPFRIPQTLGAPGPDFGTWETTKLNRPFRIPRTLGAPGPDSGTWETTKLNRPFRIPQTLGAPSFRLFSGERVGNHKTLSPEPVLNHPPQSRVPQVPTLGPGKPQNPIVHSESRKHWVPHPFAFFLSHGWETTKLRLCGP